MPDQINWGMIGIGNVTEKKSGPAFSKVAHSKLVAVMGRNAEKAADYASGERLVSASSGKTLPTLAKRYS